MTVVATVTLSVSNAATGPVTGVRADPPVSLTPCTVLSPLGGPSPPVPGDGLTIAPGQSKAYKQKYKLVVVGTVNLSVKASLVKRRTVMPSQTTRSLPASASR